MGEPMIQPLFRTEEEWAAWRHRMDKALAGPRWTLPSGLTPEQIIQYIDDCAAGKIAPDAARTSEGIGEVMDTQLFDVVAVNIETGAERVMERGLTERNADAYVTMAVMRRGVEEEFFKAIPSSPEPPKGA